MIKAQEKINDLELAKVTLDVCNSLNIVSIHDCYNSGGSQGHVGIKETTQSYQEEGNVLGKTDRDGVLLINSTIRKVSHRKALSVFFLISTGDNYA